MALSLDLRYNYCTSQRTPAVLLTPQGMSKPLGRSTVFNPTQLSFLDPIVISLTRGYAALVDLIDSDLSLLKWRASGDSHVYAKRTSKNISMHRVIMIRILERELLPSEFVDHIDGNTLNNCRSNLRLATHNQNVWNSRLPITNTSGYKGVYSERGKWRAHINVYGRYIHLGYYNDPEMAGIAYNHAALRYYGDYAKFNDIPNWRLITPDTKCVRVVTNKGDLND
jgi:hypothetical protein